jgi:fructose-1,6-bisphosphatase/inositol monophosphatase family enzyme
MTRVRFLDHIRAVLTEAALAGAGRVLRVRREALTTLRYKPSRHGSPGELVTLADERSDAAMSAVFERHLSRLSPAVGWHLEESGLRVAGDAARRVGADPLDGTQHFASGGNLYCVQAHYLERGVPLIGVIFQPEVYLPVTVRPGGVGRLAWAIRGAGAFVQRSEYRRRAFVLGRARAIPARPRRTARALTACVPIGVKMSPTERRRATRVLTDELIGATVGAGSAGANILMVVFGGQDVYANLGAGNELDIAPGQVIAQEAGLAVRTSSRRVPVWDVWKQPVIVAPSATIADRVLRIAGV